LTFPTLQELAAAALLTDEKPAPSKGLFWELFGGSSEALLQDVVQHSDRYSSELVVLARDVLECRKKMEELSDREKNLLNMGAFEFAQYRPEAEQKQKAPASPPRPTAARSQPVEPPPSPEPGVDVPEGASLRPYWWA
jgi:hypothetical protein